MIEVISDLHCLFVNVHIDNISQKDFLPHAAAFSNTPSDGDNLSSNWCAHCTPEAALELIGNQKRIKDGMFKDPSKFQIWKFYVSSLRYEVNPSQEVVHNPTRSNYSHSLIIGNKPKNVSEFRVKMLKAGKWASAPSL